MRRHLCGESRGWRLMEAPQAGPQFSTLNSQISILFFRLGHFSTTPHYIAGGGKAGRNFSVSRGRRIHGTGRGGRTSSYDFCLSGASRMNKVKREEERGKSRNSGFVAENPFTLLYLRFASYLFSRNSNVKISLSMFTKRNFAVCI